MTVAVDRSVATLAEAITALFQPHVEVALHDLASGQIVRLWNPISGRRPGDESLIEPKFKVAGDAVIGPYEQVDVRGHRITSVSMPVDDGRGLLCINFDRSPLDGAIRVLTSLAAAQVEQPPALFARDWRVRINESISNWCASRNLIARDLDRASRADLVKHLQCEGVFDTRNAAQLVASALGVSRATVYNQRKELSP